MHLYMLLVVVSVLLFYIIGVLEREMNGFYYCLQTTLIPVTLSVYCGKHSLVQKSTDWTWNMIFLKR
jgi:hypothetical protein